MVGWLAAAAVVVAVGVAMSYNLIPGLGTAFTGSTAEAHGQTDSPLPAAGAPSVAAATGSDGTTADLAAKQAELNNRSDELTAQESQVAAMAQTAAGQQAAADAVGRVGQLYAAMPPAKAAAILKNMDDAAVVGILRAVDQDQAGMILASMDPARSAQITAQLMKPAPPVTTTTP
jgi:hypothetical protein